MTYELMQREFPDFDQSTLPAIPAGWIDISWHNDVSPSFEASEGIRVYVDYASPADREFDDSNRFAVHADSDGSTFDSDDWAEILSFVTTKSA